MGNNQSQPRKAIVVHSPRAGRSEQLADSLTTLRQFNINIVDTLSIAALDTLPPQGKQWQKNSIDLVIAAGGDGLVGGVIAHLANCDLPLGILPLGTANDVARTVGIAVDPHQAAEIIATGKCVSVDIGVAQPAEQPPHYTPAASASIPPSKHMFFAHALTVGLNVRFARLATDAAIRQQYGPMTYPFAVLEAIRNYHPIELELHFDGMVTRTEPSASLFISDKTISLRCKAAQATVVNAPIFWGAFQATVPGVSLRDRLLDIVVVEDAGIDQLMLRITRFFSRQEQRPAMGSSWHASYPDLLYAELTDIPGIHHVKARNVIIDTIGGREDVTLDGEIRGQTPIHARVADEQLRLIVPHSFIDSGRSPTRPD
jgi:diacylglycerol kinase (ATP)